MLLAVSLYICLLADILNTRSILVVSPEELRPNEVHKARWSVRGDTVEGGASALPCISCSKVALICRNQQLESSFLSPAFGESC